MDKTREINAIDAKILKDLLKDGRKSFTKIAKECGKPKSTIWRHYKELEKAGIIAGTTIQIRYANLGYHATGTVDFDVTPEAANHAAEFTKKIPNVFTVWQLGKNTTISAIAHLKDVAELDQIRQKLKKLPSISGLRTSVWIGIRSITENLELIPLNEKTRKADTPPKKVTKTIRESNYKIDQTDIKIVEKLAENSRASFRKIAEAISSSTNTVARRYERLKRNGIIKVLIQINPKKLGYRALVHFRMKFLAQSNLSTAIETIAKIPDVTLIIKTSGVYDLSTYALIKDVGQLLAMQDTITNTKGVAKVETTVGRTPAMLPFPRENISTF